jgi:hypothetical protein
MQHILKISFRVTQNSRSTVFRTVTTLTANTRVVGVWGVKKETSLTPPAGVIERLDTSSTGTGSVTISIGDAVQPTAGASGTATATSASAGDSGSVRSEWPTVLPLQLRAGVEYGRGRAREAATKNCDRRAVPRRTDEADRHRCHSSGKSSGAAPGFGDAPPIRSHSEPCRRRFRRAVVARRLTRTLESTIASR